MPEIKLNELIKVGLHFGHAASSWNPKMAPYIFGTRKRVHILNLKHTVRSLVAATHMVAQKAAQGSRFLFVGTKLQAQQVIRDVADATDSYYVNERWLGGMLTNHNIAMMRMERMAQLEEIINNPEHAQDYSKKMLSSFNRELKKLKRDLYGVRGMTELPQVMVVIDPKHEHIAVKEANLCGIPIIALTDTNCDPEPIDLVIPGNDDSTRSIRYILGHLKDSILEGRGQYEAIAAQAAAEAAAAASAPAEAEEVAPVGEGEAAPAEA